MAKSYVPLEKDLVEVLGGKAPTFDGSSPSLFASTSFLYTLFFVVIVVVASVKYIQVGLLRMEASESGIRKSNDVAKKTTLGLLGIFSLWLILSTVNKDLLTGDVGLDKLKATSGGSFGGAGASGVIPKPSTNAGGHSYEDRVKSHNSVVAKLSPSNIHTNHNDVPCTEAQFNQSTPSCTSLAYLSEETIQMLLKINSDCHCTLIVSGGTEPGHSINGAHREGGRGIDLKINASKDISDPLYTYLKNTSDGAPSGESDGCYVKYKRSTFTFCDEKPRGNSTWAPHFHVQ